VLTIALGTTNPCPIAVHTEPFSTSVFKINLVFCFFTKMHSPDSDSDNERPTAYAGAPTAFAYYWQIFISWFTSGSRQEPLGPEEAQRASDAALDECMYSWCHLCFCCCYYGRSEHYAEHYARSCLPDALGSFLAEQFPLTILNLLFSLAVVKYTWLLYPVVPMQIAYYWYIYGNRADAKASRRASLADLSWVASGDPKRRINRCAWCTDPSVRKAKCCCENIAYYFRSCFDCLGDGLIGCGQCCKDTAQVRPDFERVNSILSDPPPELQDTDFEPLVDLD